VSEHGSAIFPKLIQRQQLSESEPQGRRSGRNFMSREMWQAVEFLRKQRSSGAWCVNERAGGCIGKGFIEGGDFERDRVTSLAYFSSHGSSLQFSLMIPMFNNMK